MNRLEKMFYHLEIIIEIGLNLSQKIFNNILLMNKKIYWNLKINYLKFHFYNICYKKKKSKIFQIK